ncbi:MAG: hypothetical protein QNK23_13685 [Crocinitomicaceae bacterium]|nr:hypothetical protein [Crocinitomicaceae bacterium]
MKLIVSIAVLLVHSIVFGQDLSLTPFDSLTARAQLNIEMPEGYKEVEIPFMRKIPHQRAVESVNSDCQIRYWIRPLDTSMAAHDEKTEEEKKNSMHPNAVSKSMMMLAVLNASNNQSQDFDVSNSTEPTLQAYNADWEAYSLIESGWPHEGYTYCYIWCLHKDDIGDVFVYVLVNKKEELFTILAELATTIKFQ